MLPCADDAGFCRVQVAAFPSNIADSRIETLFQPAASIQATASCRFAKEGGRPVSQFAGL